MSTAKLADVEITLSLDESVVLFEFLQRFSNSDRLTIEDQAEQRALWNLCCILEKAVDLPAGLAYEDALESARQQLRDD